MKRCRWCGHFVKPSTLMTVAVSQGWKTPPTLVGQILCPVCSEVWGAQWPPNTARDPRDLKLQVRS